MLPRPMGQIAGMTQPVNTHVLSQRGIASNVVAASTTLLVSDIMQGILNRTGPGAGFTDTWPTADQIIAAMENPQVGDEFSLIYRNGVAFAMTFAAGTGIVSGVGTLGVAASLTRLYSMTLLSTKRTVIGPVTTTNTTLVLTNVPKAIIQQIMPGMGVTGTGIGASAIVLGVSEDAQTVAVSVASTATADNIPVTFFPRVRLDSPGSMTS